MIKSISKVLIIFYIFQQKRTGPIHLGGGGGGGAHGSVLPESRQRWKPRWAGGGGGGGGGLVHFFHRASVLYFNRGTRDPTSYPGKIKWRAKKKMPEFAQSLTEFARNLPRVWPNLPEICPNICPNIARILPEICPNSYIGKIGGGGGHSAPCPLSPTPIYFNSFNR